jgi:hypothetical protein
MFTRYYLSVTQGTVGIDYTTTYRFTEKVMRKEAKKCFRHGYNAYTFVEWEMVKTVAE